MNVLLGTPPHALKLATSEEHTQQVLLVNEEFGVVPIALGGDQNERVRADIVFYETPSGGAVFSVGSISWCGSLPFNAFENNVSRITENVLRRFMAGENF
jgi:N,N-dimethylformamidase